MPAIKSVEFRQFSAQHRNIQRNWMIVILHTDVPGLFGLGDASAIEDEEAVKLLIRTCVDRYLVGKDPVDSEVLWTTLYNNRRGRGGRLVQTAISGIDIALWDLKGKILQRPVYQLLGGAYRRSIRVYANGWYTSPGSPQQNADEARRVVDMGYTALKFDPFGHDSYYTISAAEARAAEDRVAAVRHAVGPLVDIMIEAHAKFNVMTAIRLGQRLEPYLPLFFEEPVSEENISELLEVRRKVNIPIATGEHLFTRFSFAGVVDAHAADILQPDIAHAGGITELKRIATLAETKHITLAPHNVCSPVGAMAEFHLDAAILNFEIQEYHAEFYDPHYFDVVEGFPRQRNGHVEMNDAPGLGLTLNDAAIAAHPPLELVYERGGRLKGI